MAAKLIDVYTREVVGWVESDNFRHARVSINRPGVHSARSVNRDTINRNGD